MQAAVGLAEPRQVRRAPAEDFERLNQLATASFGQSHRGPLARGGVAGAAIGHADNMRPGACKGTGQKAAAAECFIVRMRCQDHDLFAARQGIG